MLEITELILGVGFSREKQVTSPLNSTFEFINPHTCDINDETSPDTVWDLNVLPWPWEDNSFDEIHAYNILEHLGRQGDYLSFFAHFDEMYRILKPGGYICGVSVDFYSPHLWADPGHTRAITRHMLSSFLSREQYEIRQSNSPLTDYRFCYNGDFEYIPIENYSPQEEKSKCDKDNCCSTAAPITPPDQFPFLLKVFKPRRF